MNETVLHFIAAAAAFAGVHVWARWFSKRHYENFPCGVCKGSGKKWEPLLLMWLCLRFGKRAFTACPACGGTSKFTR